MMCYYNIYQICTIILICTTFHINQGYKKAYRYPSESIIISISLLEPHT